MAGESRPELEMDAVTFREPGGPEVLELRRVPRPEAGSGEVLVRVESSGVNRADLLQRQGRYPAPRGYPQEIPGLEFAGTVETVGPGVHLWSEGDLVMGITGGGGYAEFVAVPERTLVRVPDGLAAREAAAIPEVYMTAFDALFLQAELAAGESLLVHAVGSGVGTAALQMALWAGARVIGTSRTDEKLRRAREMGLHSGIGASDDWPERVLSETGGRGVDVILDLVGASYLAGNLRALASRGRHVVVGVPSGARAEVDLRLLMTRRATLRGTVLRARPEEEKALLARTFERRIVPLFESGALSPVIDRMLPAARAAEAHRLLEENRTFGKVLLTWWE